VPAGPGIDRTDDHLQFVSRVCQLVAAFAGLYFPVHQLQAFQAAEPLRERGRVAASDIASQFIEAAGSVKQGTHDMQNPFFLQYLDGFV
jgi:hypothetical protein